MKKWYYSVHAPTGGVSIFETAEYEGRGGYDSKAEAVDAARKDLLRAQRETTLNLVVASNNASRYAETLDQISRSLLSLK